MHFFSATFLSDFVILTSLSEHCAVVALEKKLKAAQELSENFEVVNAAIFLSVPGSAKKRPEHSHALFSRIVKVNQHKSFFVMTEYHRMCTVIFT